MMPDFVNFISHDLPLYFLCFRYVFMTNSVSQPGQAAVKVTINNDTSQSVFTNIVFTVSSKTITVHY